MPQGFLWGLSYFSDSPWEVAFWVGISPIVRVVLSLTVVGPEGWGGSGVQGRRETWDSCAYSPGLIQGNICLWEGKPCLPLWFLYPVILGQIIISLAAFETCSFEPKLGLFHKIPYLEFKARSDLFPMHCELLFHCQGSAALSYRTQVRFC